MTRTTANEAKRQNAERILFLLHQQRQAGQLLAGVTTELRRAREDQARLEREGGQ